MRSPFSLSKNYMIFENGCLALLALLVLHLCKVSCLCRCIVQRLCSADISVLAYNFWQATKASLLWGVAPSGVRAAAPHTQPLSWGKGFGDRDREFALSYKNRLFLQAETVSVQCAFTVFCLPVRRENHTLSLDKGYPVCYNCLCSK